MVNTLPFVNYFPVIQSILLFRIDFNITQDTQDFAHTQARVIAISSPEPAVKPKWRRKILRLPCWNIPVKGAQ